MFTDNISTLIGNENYLIEVVYMTKVRNRMDIRLFHKEALMYYGL